MMHHVIIHRSGDTDIEKTSDRTMPSWQVSKLFAPVENNAIRIYKSIETDEKVSAIMKNLAQLVLLLLAVGFAHGVRLTVSGTKFMYNGKTVFMSGTNFAWYNYGNDFGNNQYANSKATFATWLNDLQLNGGNTVRK